MIGLTQARARWCVALWICFQWCAVSDAAQDDQKTGTIYLKNGDYVRGTFAATSDPSMLNWACSSFREPIEFDLRGVDYVSFVGPAKKKTPTQPPPVRRVNPLAAGLQTLFRAIPTPPPAQQQAPAADAEPRARVQMFNENVLFGNLVALDDAFVVMDSDRHGRIKLHRELVTEIDGVSKAASLVFDGASSISPWDSFGSDKQSIGHWELAGDGLSTEYEGASIYAKYPAIQRLVCEVELSGKKSPGFQVTIGANQLPQSMPLGVTLESWGTKVVLHRQVGEELKHIELNLPSLGRSDWRLSLQLYIDLDAKSVTAYSAGRNVGELKLDASTAGVPGSGVVLRNRGDSLKVHELRIRNWIGPVRTANPELDMVVMTDGEWLEGQIKTFADDSLTIEVDGKDQQVPLEKVDQLRFHRVQDIPPMPETDDLRVTYLDGAAVNGRYLKIDGDAIWIQSQVSNEPIRLATAGIANAKFASPDPPSVNERKTGLVEFFGCSFHGRVVNGQAEARLEWESVYSNKPVPFSPGAMTRVSFEPSQHDLGLNRMFSELALSNGDRIPCDVEYIDEEEIVAVFAGGERANISGDWFKALRDSQAENWVYRGFTPDEQWMMWKQSNSPAFELLPNGAMHFYSSRLLAKEFKDLPELARISFDIRFNTNSSFVIGYGADTAVHAVRPSNSYSYTQEMLEQAAKQRPDSLIEFTIQKSGDTLQARGMSRVAGILGLVMQNRIQTSGRVSAKTLTLDDNAVAHVDILIDRRAREFTVMANGKELYRWHEPGPLRGTFLHLGASPDASVSRSRSQGPLFSIFNFRIARWPGEMTDEHLERFLTRRMGTHRKATTHVLRAANGDSLRGQLVRVEKDAVVFKSRLRTFRIERDKIVAIITLRLPGAAEVEDDSQASNPEDTAHAEVERTSDDEATDERLTRIRLWGGGTVSLREVRADEAMVKGKSPLVGPVSVPWEAISAIDFSGTSKPDNAFVKWVLRDPPPLPEAPTQSPGESAESPWLDKPAPDFELDLNDGRRVALADFKGKPVVLDFWATWCGPCLASMPSVMELAEDYGDKVQVIAVNMQEDPEEVKEFLTARLWQLTVGFDESGALGRTFNVTSIPCTMVIDGDGVVRHVHIGASPTLKEDLKTVIDAL